MEVFFYQLSAGVANGGIYASVALALVMIDLATHHINFAQGEMATMGTFVAWALLQTGLTYWFAFGLAVAISMAAGLLIHRVIIRPFERAPVLNNVVVFVGLMVTLNAMSGWIFGHTIKEFPSPFASAKWLGNKYFSAHSMGSLLVMMVMLGILFAFFRFTRLGLAMRAAASNPLSARFSGIRVSWMLALGWGFAAAIGSVAGMMVAPVLYLDPNMMSGVLLYAFAAALLGGIHNPWGAVLGGFIVGILENLLGAYVTGTELKLSVALVLIVSVLMFKPSGIFGKKIVSRV